MKVAIGLPLHIVAKTAREEERVLLTGQGADELFGGYSRHEGFFEQGADVLDRRFTLTLRTSQQSTLKETTWLAWQIPLNSGCLFWIKSNKTGLAISPELKVRKKKAFIYENTS